MFAASLSSGDKLYSTENLAWRKSVGAAEIGEKVTVGAIETGGEEGKGQKRGAVKKGWSFAAQCVRIAEEVGKTAESLARARFFFCPIAVSFARPGY